MGAADKSKEEQKIRSPICTVLGHVDHGKSSLLDFIRHTTIVKSEPGAITQAIGASIVPLKTLQFVCGNLLKNKKISLTIPGLLFIDTPGHAAFTSLRKRGGSLADIAIVVIDGNEGVMPQTLESIEILKQAKTPFVIAANKIDLIPGWKSTNLPLFQEINSQQQRVIEELDKRMYTVVGQLYEKFQISADRFDRIDDYTKTIAIIPTSAKTGQGIPELLMVIAGLAQKFLEVSLRINVSGSAKGTVLEVKEEKGVGTVIDTILYDGSLKKNDMIVIGNIDKPTVTKVKGLFEPAPLSEMRDKKARFKAVDRVTAATGVRIVAPELESVIGGMPLLACSEKDLQKTIKMVQEEVSAILISTDQKGIIIKADSLGSLEALSVLLKERGIKIKKAGVGNISKKDIAEAECNFEEDALMCALLGFNVKDDSNVRQEKVKIITNDVIYRIIEDFFAWQDAQKKLAETKDLQKVVSPAKIQILPGYVFRQSNPAIVGVEVLEGKLRTQADLLNKKGKMVGTVKNIQLEKENLSVADKGKRIAVAIEGATVGRQINEGDVLYTFIPEEDFRSLKNLKKYLTKEEIEVAKEVAEFMRKDNPSWGL